MLSSGLVVLALAATAQPLPAVAVTPVRPAAPAGRAAVDPVVTSIPAESTARVSARDVSTASATTVLAAVAPRDLATFNLVGASWTASTGTVTVEVRTKSSLGWTDWTVLSVEDGGDTASRTAEPVYVGDSSGIELRATGGAGTSIQGLSATAVASPAVAADSGLATVTSRSVATSGVPAPAIISRAAWGADENLKASSGTDCMDAKVDGTVKAAVIHHTAGSNDYTAAQSASIVRGIYAYHVTGNGWCDIGYNFLVDRYGQIFEGRFGGINLPIHGAHAGSWNTDTVGVSFMMNTSTVQPSDASVSAAASLLAWKLGMSYRNPQGTTTLVGATRPVIFGHGEVMATDCPGTNLRARLQEIRDRTAQVMAGRQNTPLNALWTSAGGNDSRFGGVHVVEQTVGAGRVVTFMYGSAYERADGQAFWLAPELDTLYGQQGGPTGPLGWPTSSQRDAGGGVVSATFEHGSLQFPMAGGSTTYAAGATYHPLTPARIVDTRIPNSRVTGSTSPGGAITFDATSGGAPATATAVTLNVTVTNTKAPGYLTVWPSGQATPVVSNLNFVGDQTVANLVTVALGTDGKVSILNGSSGSSDIVVDLAGYYTAGAPTNGGGTVAVTPTRILDSRAQLGTSAAVAGYGTVTLKVIGGGVPTNAAAVLLNLTVTETKRPGWVAAYPAGGAAPTVSNLNFAGSQTTANLALVKIGPAGQVVLRNGSTASIQLIADVMGYVTGSGSGGAFVPADQPVRILDTRIQVGATGPVAPLSVTTLGMLARAGMPASGIKAVVLNLTVTEATQPGYITAFPGDTGRPNTSNLNFLAGQVVANQVVVGVAPDGTIALASMSSGTVQLVADLAGYLT